VETHDITLKGKVHYTTAGMAAASAERTMDGRNGSPDAANPAASSLFRDSGAGWLDNPPDDNFHKRQYSVFPICGGAFNPLDEFPHLPAILG
jgi:hypothetical protein